MRLYLAFLGTQTIPIRANGPAHARREIIKQYASRGIHLANREVAVRLAKRTDAGWLRDMGAPEIADELLGVPARTRTSR